MTTSAQPTATFEETDTRADQMRETIEEWIQDLVEATDEAQASETFRAWLDVHSWFHDYSYRNTLLIKHQCPEATRVAGYRTWQIEFDRTVRKGERAIWIWAPIIAKQCPACGNSASYHERNDCDYDETPPEEWSKGLVGFRPVSVFDVTQTEGEPLPELETAAAGETTELVLALEGAAESLDVSLRLVPDGDWSHGEAKGVCQWSRSKMRRPSVEVQAGLPEADLAVTIVHEYAHALLHVDESEERGKREVEAEAVAYVVGRYLGLDVSGSAFYVSTWSNDAPSAIEERLGRISDTAETVIEAIDVERSPEVSNAT